jgi:hypothetical protein
LLLGAACLDLDLSQPLFVPRTGPPPLSPGVEPDIDWDCSTPELRALLVELAGSFSTTISLDAFASSSTALAPRFFSAEADSRAEGVDAFAQPDWGTSVCPHRFTRHQEFLALTPPFTVTAQALRKAQCDEACGVMVVPFRITAPW